MPTDTAGAGFTGFGAGMMPFLAELAENQSRDWFVANRARFDREIGRPMEQLVASASLALAALDVPLVGTKASIFRMNRDVRFSRDKSPYKTNASAVLTRTGTKHSDGVLYIHAGLGECFLAFGFYSPEPAMLAALRDAIATRPATWRKLVADLDAAGLALSREAMAARLPRGFNAAVLGDLGDWIRLKSFVVMRRLSSEDVSGPELVDVIATFAASGLPLLRFGWEALAALPPRGRAATA